jgi:outer membrane receptor for ferrienterochelin and colicin
MLFLSSKNIMIDHLDTSYMYIPPLDYFFKNRLSINNNQINFNFQGDDLELIINNENKDCIKIKIINKDYKITYNNNLLLSKNYNFLINRKNKKYIIYINNNTLNVLVDYSYNIIKILLPINYNFIMNSIDISSETGGWFIN